MCSLTKMHVKLKYTIYIYKIYKKNSKEQNFCFHFDIWEGKHLEVFTPILTTGKKLNKMKIERQACREPSLPEEKAIQGA